MTALGRAVRRTMAASVLLLPAVGVFAPNGITILLILCALVGGLRLMAMRQLGAVAGVPGMTTVAGIWAALVLWGALSAVWSLAPGDSLAAALRLFGVAVAALVVWSALRGDAFPVGRWFLIGFLLAAVLLAVELAFRSPIRALVQERPGGPDLVLTWWVNRPVSVMTLLTWPAMVVAHRVRGWPAALAVALIGAILIVMGPQRTALFSGLGGGLVFLLFMLLRARAAYVLAVGMSLAVLVMPLAPRWLPEPTALHESRPGIDFSLIHRLHIWGFTAERIAERPIVGWGLRSSRHVPGGDEIVPGAPGPAPYISLHPHSGPLQLWLELGLVGAIIGAGLLTVLALALRRLADDGIAMAAGSALMASAFVFASLSYGLWQTWWLATLSMAAGLLALARAPAGAGR